MPRKHAEQTALKRRFSASTIYFRSQFSQFNLKFSRPLPLSSTSFPSPRPELRHVHIKVDKLTVLLPSPSCGANAANPQQGAETNLSGIIFSQKQCEYLKSNTCTSAFKSAVP
jgi:hypothetical protein